MPLKDHWENVYATKPAQSVSWYQPRAALSLSLIDSLAHEKSACLIDVGGGASTLVDDLLVQGHVAVTILDLSQAALDLTKKRLGQAAAQVQWIQGNITTATLPQHGFDIWHDRAVFHFLTTPEERRAYVAQVNHALKPGGWLIVATFSLDGPEKCSGLPVVRYSPQTLHRELGEGFRLKNHTSEEHLTPAGKVQHFTYCLFQKGGAMPTPGNSN